MAGLTKAERIKRAEKSAATRKAKADTVKGLVGFARLEVPRPGAVQAGQRQGRTEGAEAVRTQGPVVQVQGPGAGDRRVARRRRSSTKRPGTPSPCVRPRPRKAKEQPVQTRVGRRRRPYEPDRDGVRAQGLVPHRQRRPQVPDDHCPRRAGEGGQDELRPDRSRSHRLSEPRHRDRGGDREVPVREGDLQGGLSGPRQQG